MQNYTEISPDTKVVDSLTAILNNDKTAISNNSGTEFPTTNLQIGMTFYHVDLKAMFVLTSLEPGPQQWFLLGRGAFPMSVNFVAEAFGEYILRDNVIVTLPPTNNPGVSVGPGATVVLSKLRNKTPTIQVADGDPAVIETAKGSDTSVLFDVDAQLTFTLNFSGNWEV